MNRTALLLCVAWVVGPACTAVAQQAGGKSKSAEALAARRDARMQLARETFVEAYEKVGSRNERWDKAARETLESTLRWSGRALDYSNHEVRKLYEVSGTAIAAGCDDALINSIHARSYAFYKGHLADPVLVRELHMKAARLLESSRYAPVRKAHAFINAALQLPAEGQRGAYKSDADAREARRLADATVALLPEIARDPRAKGDLREFCRLLFDMYLRLDGDRKPAFDRISAVLTKDIRDSAILHTIRGDFFVDYAWDARGGEYANKVPAAAWKLFSERLNSGAEALERSWKIDPTDPWTAARMITVELGQGRGRARMELWFRRAVEADPRDYGAYGNKLHYLEPKWHGSARDMKAFGTECLRSASADNPQAALVIVDVHARLAEYVDHDGNGPNPYFRSPEVWEDIRKGYEAYLKLRPNHVIARSNYAKDAGRSGQWKEAHRQCQILGDNGWESVFDGHYAEFRQEAAAKAMAE